MSLDDIEVKVVNRDVSSSATLANVDLAEFVVDLNGFGSAKFSVPTLSTPPSALKVLEHEVQIWVDGNLEWWGPIIRAEADADRVNVQCQGLLWYASRRYFGPNLSQFLVNRDFESGLSDWTAVNCTATAQSGIRLLGTQAARLTAASGDAYITQTFEFVHAGPPGNQVIFEVAAWYYIDASVPFVAPPFEERGLWASCPALPSEHRQPINLDSPTIRWERLVTEVGAPTGATSDIEIRLYALEDGAIVWDAASLKVSHYTGASPPADLGSVVMVALANELSIPFNFIPDCDAIGIDEDRRFLYEDHGNVWEAMGEWPARNISDIEIEYGGDPTGLPRTFRTRFPRQGTPRMDLALVGGPGGNIISWSYPVDGAQTATRQRVLGAGSGPTREVGLAHDTMAVDGLLLDAIETAPTDTTIGVLNEIAAEELARKLAPLKVPTVKAKAEGLLGELNVGDTVPLTIDHGWVQEDAIWRVQRIRYIPKEHAVEIGLAVP